MKKRFVFLVVFMIVSNITWAQSYFSKPFRLFDDNTYTMELLPLEDQSFIISMMRVGGFDYMNTGWLHLSNEGEVIDSFFFETHLLTLDGFHVMHKIGDTILQIARHRDDVRQEIHVYGSSFSRRDSIFHWRYSFEEFGDIVSIRGGTSTMTSDSTLVIFGIYRKNDQHTQSRFIMGIELDLDGNVLRKKEIHRFDTRFNIFSFQAPVLVKDDFYYLSPSLKDVETPRYILKVNKELDLEFITTYPKKTNVDRYYHGFTFNHDSTQIIISDARHIEHEDIAHLYEGMEEEEYWDSILLFIRHPFKMTAYDTDDGSIIWDRIYLERKPGIDYNPLHMISSKMNGDLIFCGSIWDSNAHGKEYQEWMGLVGRADPEGELKWKYKIIDHFGAPWIFGAGFNTFLEEINGDLVLLGGIDDFSILRYSGWIVRLGPDGCVQENHCFNDTLSFHTFTSSVQPAIRGELTVYLQAYPNPVRAGHPVYLRQEGHVFTGKPLEYNINDLKGNIVAQGRLDGLSSYQIVVELPPGILPGVYLIDLIENREKKYHAKIVVSGT
jgi:hypothetical protein